ncbi:MAG TPA: hypothetical protein VG055_32025, partial [Planctomycetaceae bacterium]|nr:hypothetical protein [Planctomycetaceae bacterium]
MSFVSTGNSLKARRRAKITGHRSVPHSKVRRRKPLLRGKSRRYYTGGLREQLNPPALYATQILENRTLLSAVTWTGGGNDNLWNDGKNWSSGGVPHSTDDVMISAAAGTTIQVATTSVTINSLNTNAAIKLESGISFTSPTTSASADFILAGGTLQGGTLTLTGGAVVSMTNSGGTLNGVTVDGNLDLTQVSGAFADVEGNLTLNGTADIGNAAGTSSGELIFPGAQSLSGTGTVVFGNSTSNAIEVGSGQNATLTI